MVRYRTYLILLSLLIGVCWVPVRGQGELTTVRFENTSITDALISLSEQSGTNIVFSSRTLEERRVTMTMQGSVPEILLALLAGTGLQVRFKDGQYLIYTPRKRANPYMLSGYVEDVFTGERLIAAHVYDLLNGGGTTTNPYGFFSLPLADPSGKLRVSYLGYTPVTIEVNALISDNVVIPMERSLTLKEVVIYSRDSSALNPPGPVHHRISGDQLNIGAHLGGEFDLHRHVTDLPGVTTGTDGIGGMNIRGGNNHQNLVLMDGVPIYNPTHAIGILSVFNPLLIQEVSLYKGSFPARYAGRLSSVMDVRTREGNLRDWSFTGSIGPLSVNSVLEGPLVRDKASVIISGRRFVPSGFLRNLSRKDKENAGLSGATRYAFGDLNVKLNVIPSSRDRLYLSFYRGTDTYRDLTERFTPMEESNLFESFKKRLEWGNQVGIVRWNHQFGPSVFANATLTWSRFSLQSLDFNRFSETILMPRVTISGFDSREFKSEIEDVTFRWDFDMATGRNNRLRFGLYAMHHTFRPKGIAFNDQAQVDDFVVDEGTLDDALFSSLQVRAWEQGLYLENELSFARTGHVNVGVHLSAFAVNGRTYVYPQPRLRAVIPVSEWVRFDAGFSTMVQHLHLLTSSGIGLPSDLWVPSTDQVRPQTSWQGSAGVQWQLSKFVQMSADVYYKGFRHLTEYREGASFLLTEGAVEASIIDAADWESKVTQGNGRSYGLEVSAQVTRGAFRGGLSYALSRSTRRFDDLNYGETFPFRYDRRHTVSASGDLRLSEVFRVSAGWTFGSGNPITLAESQFLFPASSPFFQPVVVLEFSERNGFRLPAYHRLDLGLSAVWRRPKAEHSVHLDLYNVYDRRNALHITLVQNPETQLFETKQFTVLPFIPSLSYRIKI